MSKVTKQKMISICLETQKNQLRSSYLCLNGDSLYSFFFFMQSNRENRPNKDSTQRTITWRPNSAKAVIPPGETVALHFNRIYDGSFFSSDVFTMAIHQTISCMTIKNISMSQMAFVEAWKGLLFHGIYCVLVL